MLTAQISTSWLFDFCSSYIFFNYVHIIERMNQLIFVDSFYFQTHNFRDDIYVLIQIPLQFFLGKAIGIP